MKKIKIQILIDNPNSWMWDHIEFYKKKLIKEGFECKAVNSESKVEKGDILLLLSCNRLYKSLNLNKHNIVVHASDLPKGKGMSPVTWQVLEGKDKIPITLFEAEEEFDSGKYYYKDYINLEGHELVDEIRKNLTEKIFKLIDKFLINYPKIKSFSQVGSSTFYPKRLPKDSELDIYISLFSNIKKLRISDNERYPSFFYYKGHKYFIKIFKSK